MVKFSELYRLLESNGWKIKKGSRHFKYVHSDFDFSYPLAVINQQKCLLAH